MTASLSAASFTAGTGTLASNYALPTTASGGGAISPATVTAAIIGTPTRPYDGTASATLTPASFSLAGLLSGQSFTVTQASGTYNSPNVASATTVTASLSDASFTAGTGTLAEQLHVADHRQRPRRGSLRTIRDSPSIIGNPMQQASTVDERSRPPRR